MNGQDWAHHFQPVWNKLVSLKRTHDPDNMRGAGLAVFDYGIS
jgi:hypothetical protein